MADFNLDIDKADMEKFQRALNQIADIDRRAVEAGVLRRGMNEVVAAGKSNLASRNGTVTGRLKKSFSTRVKRKKDYAVAYGGFKRGAGYGGNIAHIVDRGTVMRRTSKGANRGKMRGSMFWTDAVLRCGRSALQNVEKFISDYIKRTFR
jgi:hypothetical protein